MDGGRGPATLTAQALVAQWIEHAPPKRGMQVRFLPGARSPPGRRRGLYVAKARRGASERRTRPPDAAKLRATVRATSCPRAPSKPPRRAPTGANPAVPPPRTRPCGGGRASYLGWLVALALVVFSAILVVWAKTRPGFDPYGWLTLGPHDPARRPGHERRAVVEAAALHLHDGLRAAGLPRAAPVDDHVGRRLAQRGHLRRTDRLQAHRRATRTALGRLGSGDLRRPGPAGHPGLLPLHPQLPVGPDDRGAVPGGDRPAPRRTHAPGLLRRRVGGPWPPRGVAVFGPVLPVGMVAAARHPSRAHRRRSGDGAAVVRDPGADLAHAVRGRRQRHGLRPPADLRPGGRHDQPLPGAALLAAGDRRPAGGGAGGLAALARRSRHAGAGRGRGRLGGRGDRLRPARLAGAGPVHVRGRGGDDRARRNIRGPGTGRPATTGGDGRLCRDGGGGGGRGPAGDRAAAPGAVGGAHRAQGHPRPAGADDPAGQAELGDRAARRRRAATGLRRSRAPNWHGDQLAQLDRPRPNCDVEEDAAGSAPPTAPGAAARSPAGPRPPPPPPVARKRPHRPHRGGSASTRPTNIPPSTTTTPAASNM